MGKEKMPSVASSRDRDLLHGARMAQCYEFSCMCAQIFSGQEVRYGG